VKTREDNKTVLIVEDEQGIRNFAIRVLELEGYKVLSADNAESAMSYLGENHIDLVLLDLRLPGEDGWSVLKKIKERQNTFHIPVIVSTASADIDRKARALEMGAAEYLIKPLSAADLRDAVARVLERKE